MNSTIKKNKHGVLIKHGEENDVMLKYAKLDILIWVKEEELQQLLPKIGKASLEEITVEDLLDLDDLCLLGDI